jgi:hypothetical protein
LSAPRVKLALGDPVFGDVGQPQHVGSGRGELSVDQVVRHRRAGLPVQPRLLGEHRPDAQLGAQPGDPVLADLQAVFAWLVGDEPAAEGRVVSVDAVVALIRCASSQWRWLTGCLHQV